MLETIESLGAALVVVNVGDLGIAVGLCRRPRVHRMRRPGARAPVSDPVRVKGRDEQPALIGRAVVPLRFC